MSLKGFENHREKKVQLPTPFYFEVEGLGILYQSLLFWEEVAKDISKKCENTLL